MEIDLKDVIIYYNPAVWTKLDGSKMIVGTKPPLPYTESLYKKVKDEYDARLADKSRDVQEFFISSKKDPSKTYRVAFDGKSWSCGCKGYKYRKTCSHIDTAKEKIQ